MKDALIKAGLISKEQVRRDEIEKKGPQQKGVHEHHVKTHCAQCNKPAEDVEYYEHTNRSLNSKWLCVSCADKNWIHDDTRQTQQSMAARSNRFQRFYGPTKKFAPGKDFKKR
ncbi:MAG: hypothetical protein IPM57_08020 [Oligoflexia bacterium]|nr:hypothetical protein [Oligoflexia bacterium]